jgi:hypothetical protein
MRNKATTSSPPCEATPSAQSHPAAVPPVDRDMFAYRLRRASENAWWGYARALERRDEAAMKDWGALVVRIREMSEKGAADKLTAAAVEEVEREAAKGGNEK